MNKLTVVSVIILSLIILLISASIFKSSKLPVAKEEKFSMTCGFQPRGITRQECLDECNMKRNNGDEGCDKDTCENKCDACISTECEWKQSESGEKVSSRTPLASKIKGFSGDRQIKVVWVEPLSRLPILEYILVVENNFESPKLYYPSPRTKLLEYSLFNLINKREYRIRLFSKNEAGISVESNILTIIPQENMKTPILTSDTDLDELTGIDSSLEKEKKDILKSARDKYLEEIGYDPKDKDYYELLKLIYKTKPKVDLGDGNIKIKFV